MPDANAGFYRVKVEDRGSADGRVRRVLALRYYRGGVEAEAVDFELSPSGSRALVDEIRWLEWHHGGSNARAEAAASSASGSRK